MWYGGWGAGTWLVMSFMMLAFWVLVIGAVVWVLRGQHGHPRQEVDRARQILDERFARGEISAEEYTSRRDHLAAR